MKHKTFSLASGIIPFRFPGVPSVQCVFTTAAFGSLTLDSYGTEDKMVVQARRTSLLSLCNLSQWAELRQVHGTAMVSAHASFPQEAASLEADGHATHLSGLGLVIKTADCQPVLIAHTSGKYIMALHVGWRGNAYCFIQKAIKQFCNTYSIKSCDLVAVRGPSLGPSAAEFINFSKEWDTSFSQWFSPATKTMDLWQLTQWQLEEAGILPRNVYSIDLCTYLLHGALFSHRQGDVGRQMSLIWREEK